MMAPQQYVPDPTLGDRWHRHGVRWDEVPAPPAVHQHRQQTLMGSQMAVCPCAATWTPGGGWQPAAVPRVGRAPAAGQPSRDTPSNVLLWLALGVILASLAILVTMLAVASWTR